jgi:hypothetical protein
LGSFEGKFGIPVKRENLARTGVEGELKWGAVDHSLASSVGVKEPVTKIPLAWAIREKHCYQMWFCSPVLE